MVVLIVCNAILIAMLGVKKSFYQYQAITTMQSFDGKDEYNQLLVNTYITQIIEASNQFYEEYYTSLPIVNYYSVFVEEVFSDNRIKYVTFKAMPYLGPHDTIGVDEITFSADYLGNVKLEKFNHLESYHLPENKKGYEKKQFPAKYYKE